MTKEPYYIKTQKRWKCRECRRQFSVKVKSIFEDSPISLKKWLPALWLLVNCKNGVSSHEIARDLGVTQKTAWFMLQRLRLALKAGTSEPNWVAKAAGVEVDESFIGGRIQEHAQGRANRVREARTGAYPTDYYTRQANKTAVLGILDRESRQIRAKVVPNVKRETLQNEILSNVKFGSNVYTDQAVAYDSFIVAMFTRL